MPVRDKARGFTLFYCLSAYATCKRTQHCWLTTPNMVGCYSWVCLHTLLHVVVYYSEWLRKVWNCSNFWANNSQYFFCSVSPKRNATTLDPFTQLFQHCRGHTRAKDGCRIQVYKVSWDCFLPTMHCRSQHCWELLQPLSHHWHIGAKTLYIVDPTMLGVVTPVCQKQ